MRYTIPQQLWHNKNAIYSCHFNPRKPYEFATAGGDHAIRIWRIIKKGTEIFPIELETSKQMDLSKNPLVFKWKLENEEFDYYMVEYVAGLCNHSGPVNVVRFSPDGEILASAGDDGSLLLWKKKEDLVNQEGNPINQDSIQSSLINQSNDEFALERWKPVMILRGSLSDIYDLAWSPDGHFIVTGSVDNTARVWDVSSGRCLAIINDHKNYVQGVIWDPLNEYIITESSDRSVKIHEFTYKLNQNSLTTECKASHSRLLVDKVNVEEEPLDNKGLAYTYLYQSENLKSFFRRPDWTPDGALLITPAGIYKDEEGNVSYSVHIYTRNEVLNGPNLRLSGFPQPPIAIKSSPIIYSLIDHSSLSNDVTLLNLNYRCIFAVATQNSVLIYDTQHLTPIAYATNLHYASLTDITWSADGTVLIVSSSDGFISLLKFDHEELGIPLPIVFKPKSAQELKTKLNSNSSSNSNQTIHQPTIKRKMNDSNIKDHLISQDIKPNVLIPKKKRAQFQLLSEQAIEVNSTQQSILKQQQLQQPVILVPKKKVSNQETIIDLTRPLPSKDNKMEGSSFSQLPIATKPSDILEDNKILKNEFKNDNINLQSSKKD